MKTKIFNRFDYILVLCTLILTTVGILFIYSASFDDSGVKANNLYIRQIIWAAVGIVLMILTALFDYRKFYNYSPILYIIISIVLAFTWKFGIVRNNSRSWIGFSGFSIQPSEIGKIIFILFLARYLEKTKAQNQLKRFALSSLIMFLPVALILLQPDLGSASVYLPIFFFMCFIANIPVKYLLITLITGCMAIMFTIFPVLETQVLKVDIPLINILTNTKLLFVVLISSGAVALIGVLGYLMFKKKYFYWIAIILGCFTISLLLSVLFRNVLMEYQIKRLIVFVKPEIDPRGAGWHIIQSEIAVGSGNLWGHGFLKGPQSHRKFTPEQSTDFIFSIFAEEMGFVGGILLFTVFLIVFIKIIFIIRQTNSSYGAYICSGILGMLFFHFVVNVGMVIGLMPITGIPLPFLSYGGSSLLTNFISIGLVMSVQSRRLDFSVGV